MARRKIRVLFPYVGDSVGGAQLSGTALVENLDREKFEPILVVHENGPFTKLLDERNINYQRLPIRTYLGRHRTIGGHLLAVLTTMPKLISFLRRNEIDLVHAQDGRMNLTWVVPAFLTSIPFVWHQRSMFAKSRLLTLGARLATRIVSISEFTSSSLPEGLKSKTSLVNNPVEMCGTTPDRQKSRAELCSRLKIDPAQSVIGFFGNLTKQKQPDIFVRIAAETGLGEYRALKFVLFGTDRDGLKRELIELAHSLSISDKVLFQEFVTDPEEWIAGCDVLVAPGLNEAFGRTLVEAMLVGTPVVASRSGGHTKIVEDERTGLLVRPGDVAGYAAAIERILGDRDLSASLTKTAADETSGRYSTKSHVAQITDVYRGVLGHDS